MDRMNPIDVSFLHIEDSDRAASLHIGSVGIFEGPPPPQADITAMVDARLDHVPRYRQRVVTVPFALGRPVWIDDDAFELDYHLRRTALPAPGDEEALRRLTGRIMSQRLDRTKPLWEIWIVEGLTDDRWAMVSKVHHCMVDGVSGSELLAIILDLTPDPPPPSDSEWVPQYPPTSAELAADALWDLATSQYEQLRALGSAMRRRRRLMEDARTLLTGLGSLRDVTAPTPGLSLTGTIGPHREVAWAEVPLADVKRVRAEFGGTVNDVVLAAIAGGFRSLLLSRGEDLAEHPVRSLVPVSVRATRGDGAATGDGELDNKVSGMFAELPVAQDDPVVRLDMVRSQLTGAEGVAPGRRRGGPHVGDRLRPAGAAGPGHPPRLPAGGTDVERPHRHHERARSPAPALPLRPAHDPGLPVRPDRRTAAHRRGRLLLRRHDHLRGHRGP